MSDASDPRATHLADPAAFAAGVVEVDGEAYRHLFRARRLARGDALRVVDGAGQARRGIVAAVDRRSARLELAEPLPSLEPALRVELVVGTPRPERAAWLVEKATELGVAAVRFVAAERTPRALGASRLERLRRVARAAVEQCGRARVPEVTGVHAWDAIGDLLASSAARFVLAPDATPDATGLHAVAVESIAVCVGPEGGFTVPEVDALRALGCRPVRLGERILRVETAAVAAAAVLLASNGAVISSGDYEYQ